MRQRDLLLLPLDLSFFDIKICLIHSFREQNEQLVKLASSFFPVQSCDCVFAGSCQNAEPGSAIVSQHGIRGQEPGVV